MSDKTLEQEISLGKVTVLVLAGGQSRRMEGQNKATLLLGGEALLSRVLARIRNQVSAVLVNLNDPVAIEEFLFLHQPLPLVADLVPGFRGPLAGLASGFDYLQQHGLEGRALLLVPCDGPFLPLDLAERLVTALNKDGADVACACYGGEAQPTFSLWRYSTFDSVKQTLFEKRQGGFKGLLAQLHTVFVAWDEEEVNPFYNINTPQDLQMAENLLATTINQ